MTSALETTNKVYSVVGLQYKTASKFGVVLIFHEPKSKSPARDVERALALHCPSVFVKLMEGSNFEEQDKSFVKELVDHGNHASRGPPLPEGNVTVCSIIGMAPGRKAPKGRMIYDTLFEEYGSTTPSKDIDRAVNAGSIEVSLEVRKWGTVLRPS